MARKAAAGQGLILSLDAGSPRVSVAVGRNGTPLAARAVAQEHSSTQLLALIDATLRDAGAQPADLAGLVAAAGPGSFTGLRVALATALGLHQALGVPAQAVSTLAALAAAAAAAATRGSGSSSGGDGDRDGDEDQNGGGSGEGSIVAAVDALRGEWSVQAFARRPAASLYGNELLVDDEPPAGGEPLSGVKPLTGIELVPVAELASWVTARAADPAGGRRRAGDGTAARPCLVAFGVAALAAAAGIAADTGIRLIEAWDGPPLAAMALRLAAAVPLSQWQPASLAAPIYARPPATTAPKRRRTMLPLASSQDPQGIRRATDADLPRLAHLEAAAFADPWSSNQLAAELHQTAGLMLVVAAPDSPHQAPATGYACFRHAAGQAELLRVAVLPASRRQGLARRLITAGLSLLRAGGVTECFLEVRPDNASALAVYHALGFRLAGRRERYYRDGSDALLYCLTI